MRVTILLLVCCCMAGVARADPPTPVTHADMAHGGMNHADMIAPKTPRILPGYGSGGFPIEGPPVSHPSRG